MAREGVVGTNEVRVVPVILGSSNLVQTTTPNKGPTASGLTIELAVGVLVPVLLLAAVLRCNPRLTAGIKERLFFGSGDSRRGYGGRAPPVGKIRPRPQEYGRASAVEREPLASGNCEHSRSQPSMMGMPTSGPTALPGSCGRCARAAPSRRSERPPSAASASMPTSAPVPPDVRLESGTQVRVTGLQNAKHHNGTEGVLISTVSSAEHGYRWNVRMVTGELLALKVQNLQPVATTPSIVAMVEALERAGEFDKASLLRSVLPDCDT